MNILSLENVSKNYGIKPLFENATFGIEERDKIGIIGANGSGKTTLLRVIAGTESPDAGKVVRTQGKTLAYLAQNPLIDENATVLETIFAASGGVMKLIADYETACHDLATGDANPKTLERVSELQHELEISGGWEIETNARIVLDKLGIFDTSAQMKTLSGGQRKRVALAHELIFKPDILILDEPTNHLDVESIEALEDAIEAYEGTVILVSHDRALLRALATRVWVLHERRITEFEGSFGEWEAISEERAHAASVRASEEEALRRVQERKRTRQDPQPSRDTKSAAKRARAAVDEAEARVAGLEQDVSKLTAELEDPALYTTAGGPQRAHALGAQLDKLRAELDKALTEWTRLTEAAELVQ